MIGLFNSFKGNIKPNVFLTVQFRPSQRYFHKSPIHLKEKFVEIRSCETLRQAQLPEYVSASHSKLHSMIWSSPMQNIFVVKKPWNPSVRDAMVTFISHIHDNYPAINVIVTTDVAEEIENDFKENPKINPTTPHILYTGDQKDIIAKTDLIVSLGGDGTILRAVSTFSNNNVPPVLSFALGTLGFLLPFDFNTFRKVFEEVKSSRAKVIHRTRLECHVVRKSPLSAYPLEAEPEVIATDMIHAMNDVVIHRGGEPHLSTLDIYIDNEFFTRTTADGIALASPTGSTAYSLSAGGSIVHPLVPCILLTPICPRSLSFRPAILPTTSHIMVKMIAQNRNSQIKLSIDGIPQTDLKPNDEIHIVSENGTIYLPGPNLPKSLSDKNVPKENEIEENKRLYDNRKKGIWCVAKSEHDWTIGINELLGFNSSFRGKNKASVQES